MAAHMLHFGEEPPISGQKGSGAIFFSHCPLSCAFCQNHQISQKGMGRVIGTAELVDIMLDLQQQGAHNINLVSPTPWVIHIINALETAAARGFNLPVVYNTGGFDSPAAIDLLNGWVDVYLPDMKTAVPGGAARRSPEREESQKLFGAGHYTQVNQAAVRAMFRQVGHLALDRDGLAVRGTLVRHLVLPRHLDATRRVLTWLAENFGPRSWVSLMAQYKPCFRVNENNGAFPELDRPLTEEEYDTALVMALDLGLENVFIQDLSAADTYLPDFSSRTVFSKTE